MKTAGAEIQWARRIANGERTACAQLLDTFGPRVRRLARRYARDDNDADDLTQEIFIAVFSSAESFRGDANLATWIYRIALNCSLRHRDKWQRENSAPAESPEVADFLFDPARHVARGELKTQVRRALDTLNDGQREVVILHELHGLTYTQCAQVLEIPIGTVKSRLFNAFRHLRARLETYVLGEEEIMIARLPQSTLDAAACGETP